MLVARRSVASLLAAALSTRDSGPLLGAEPPPSFQLTLPPNFVKIGSTNGKEVLLMAGDFRGMIASTGAATTISVQRVTSTAATLPIDGLVEPEAAAKQLVRLRDLQSGLPAGCVSQVIPSSVSFDGSILGVEFLTPLVSNNVEDSYSVEELKRHSLARAVSSKEGDALLVMWAGAKVKDWDEGAGEALRAAASTFGLSGY